MDEKRTNQSKVWGVAATWYGAALLLCTIGTVLAYRGPLSSQAWREWSGPGAWKVDVMRAIVTSILAAFVLWNLEVLTPTPFGSTASSLKLCWYERALLAGIVLLLGWLNFVALPEHFRQELIKRQSQVPRTFGEIVVPYFPYFIYIVGFYVGIAFPVLLFFMRRVLYDWKKWHEARAKFFGGYAVGVSAPNATPEGVQEFALQLQDYVVKLKDVAERYVPVLLAITLALLYEQLTPSYRSVTQAAVEFTKVAVWILLVPISLIWITMVALGYQGAIQKAETGLRSFSEASFDNPNRSAVLDKVVALRTELLWKQSPAEFVLSVIKSANISILLFVTITAYVLKSLAGAHHWLEVFIPRGVLDFFRNFFGS